MSTAEEFAAVCRACARRTTRAFRLAAVAVALWLLGGLVLFVWVCLRDAGQDGVSAAVIAVIALLTVPPAMGAAILGWWLDRAARRTAGAVCPNCEQLLTGPLVRQRVVATRRCPGCRARVLPDPGACSGDAPLRTLAVVETAERSASLRALLCLLGWIVCQQIGLIATTGLDGIVSESLLAVVVFALLIIPLVGVVNFFVSVCRTDRQTAAVRCPHCGGRPSVALLRDTGNCGHCGRHAVALPEWPPPG